jgi:hypothetical protein
LEHFNKAKDILSNIIGISDGVIDSEQLETFYERLNLHLLTSEMMDWFPFKGDKRKEYLQETNAAGIQDLKTIEGLKDVSLVFKIMESLFSLIQADIERDEILSDWDSIGIVPEKLRSQLIYLNIQLVKIDFFFMSYENINELLSELDQINFVLSEYEVGLSVEKTSADLEKSKRKRFLLALLRDKTNFLFRKALWSRMDWDEGKKKEKGKDGTPDSELEFESLQHIYNYERFGIRFIYDHLLTCFEHYKNYEEGCSVLPSALKRRIKNADVNLNLTELHWGIRQYRQVWANSSYADDDTLKENLKQLELIKNIFKNENKKIWREQKHKVNYDELNDPAHFCVSSFLECAIFRVSLHLPENRNMEAFRRERKEKIEDQDYLRYHYFYKYRIFVEYCLRLLEEKKYSCAEEIQELISTLNKAVADWKSQLYKAFQNNFHPYFMPVSESVFNCSYSPIKNQEGKVIEQEYPDKENPKLFDTKINLFISSSYMLPFDKRRIAQEINKFKLAIAEYENKFIEAKGREVTIEAKLAAEKKAEEIAETTAQKTAKDIAEATADKTARSTTKDSELRAIQVLSVFVTVVVFAGNAIVVEKYISSFVSAFTFLAILGFVLTVFVYLLLFHLRLTRSKEDRIEDYKFKRIDDLQKEINKIKSGDNSGGGNEPKPPKGESWKEFWSKNQIQIVISAIVFAVYIGILYIGINWTKTEENKKDQDEIKKQDSIIQAKEKNLDSIQKAYDLHLNRIEKQLDSLKK